MKQFCLLYLELDRTTRRSEKRDALLRYFERAPAEDAAYAVHLLCGQRLIRAVNTRRLREWAADASELPAWLIDECYDVVGDLSETLSLIVPGAESDAELSLTEVIRDRVLPLDGMSEAEQRPHIEQQWRAFSQVQRFLFHKLISGAFRVGVARGTVIDALAAYAKLPSAVIAHRLLRPAPPSAEQFEKLCAASDESDDPAQPYPFFLASPLEAPLESLGDVSEWQIEWKWDGIRGQLIRRECQHFLWSRGLELVDAQFPELMHIGPALARDAVLDGEILAWEDDQPLPFNLLQRRLNRKNVQPMLFPDVPVVFMAYDILEIEGVDVRSTPLCDRRLILERLIDDTRHPLLKCSPIVSIVTWSDVSPQVEATSRLGREGLMLKRSDSTYGVSRERGAWWKLKRAPLTLDVVMTAAQRGHGKRATLYTDYTFAIRDETTGTLVNIAKAYSGLSDDEIREVDRFIRTNTERTAGPLRIVRPERVFEIAFEGIRSSTRHRAGIALRFPRIARLRQDKSIEQINTLADARQLLAESERKA